MQEKELTPIPIPARQQWREFRVIYLPFLTFALLVVLIGWMWARYITPATIIGEVESQRASIISTLDGTIQEIKVDRLASVTNGQELATIAISDAAQLDAQITATKADLRLMKARLDLDNARNVNSYTRLRRELAVEKLNLEIARIESGHAGGKAKRAKTLGDTQLVASISGIARNDAGYDASLRDDNSMVETIAAQEKTVAELQAGVDRLKAAGASDVETEDPVIEQNIAAQSREIEQLQKPAVLLSPINGFVSVIDHLAGEKIASGEQLLVVSAEKSHRILAWVRQPVTERPHPGDIVHVRRASQSEPFEATVATVGKQLEVISPTAVPLAVSTPRAEFGLPLIVNVDGKIDLIPGEAVQLRIVKRAPVN